MFSRECLEELRSIWLPNTTDAGLDRLVELLERASPLLVHGCFTRTIPMGCLATHIAWNHPNTKHLTQDAGIMWLHRVARLNPATSQVLREWDRCGVADMDMRNDLLIALREEKQRRLGKMAPSERLELVEVG